MTIYICLLLLVLIGSLFAKSQSSNNKYVISIFIILFMLYAFRGYSVGRDLEGYSIIYHQSGDYQFFDSSWIYMEPGYVFLMKLCNTIGLTFRAFIYLIYGVFCIILSSFIRKYSKDSLVSIILFICFQFFVFSLSGLRQTLAIGLCTLAFIIGKRNNIKSLLLFIVITLLAATIHKSAVVFFPAYLIMRIPLTKLSAILYLGISLVLYQIRPLLLAFLQDREFTNYEFNESLTVGSTFALIVLLIGMALFLSSNEKIEKKTLLKASENRLTLAKQAHMVVYSALLLFSFSGTILMRASMYYEIVLLLMVPQIMGYMKNNSRMIFKYVFITLMIIIFYTTVLIPRQFDIVPYVLGNDLFAIFK